MAISDLSIDDRNGTRLNPDVFISYSRKDKAFVEHLYQALIAAEREIWVDWEDIPLTADWWQEIQHGIETANTVVFVLSADSIASSVCHDEIEHAVQHHKRLIPVVRRDGFPASEVHPALAKRNWVFFREQDHFETAFTQLLQALDTDLEHVKCHTRFLVKAIEWDTQGRYDSSLLRGQDLINAEQWLAESTAKEPFPTSLQQDYIHTSRTVEDANRRATEILEAAARKGKRRVLTGTIAAGVGFAIAAASSWIALKQTREAITNEIRAQAQFSDALFSSKREFRAIGEALQAARLLQNADWVDPHTRLLVSKALGQSLANVREKNRLEGHQSWIRRAKFSPDGQLIASASGDRTIRLWHRDGTYAQTLSGHTDGVYDVTFSPDGQLIASASNDKTLKLWNREGKLLQTFTGHTDRINTVNFSPDGKLLVSSSQDKTVRVWKLDGTLLKTLPHPDIAWSATFSPDGQTIASANQDGAVRLWNLEGELLKTLKGHTNYVVDVKFSPDGQFLASASLDKTIRLWSLDGKLLNTLREHEDAINEISFNPVPKLGHYVLASAGSDKLIKLWRVWQRSNTQIDVALLEPLNGHTSFVNGVHFSPDGEELVSASQDMSVRIWRSNQVLKSVLTGHTEPANSVSFGLDRLVSGSSDNTLKLWAIDGKLLKTLKGHRKRVLAVSFSPDGQLIASASQDRTVKLWTRDGVNLKTIPAHDRAINDVSFAPDGTKFVSASVDKTAKIWDRDGKLLATLQGHESMLYSARFSPDGQLIATSSRDRTVKLWRLDGTLVKTFPEQAGAVRRMAFSPDGQMLATAGEDRTVKVWKLDGTLLTTMKGHEDIVNHVLFSPNGQTIASASDDRTVRLWKPDGTAIAILTGHTNSVFGLSFSSDNKQLATSSDDSRIIVWTLDALETPSKLAQKGCDWLQNYFATSKASDDDSLSSPQLREFCQQALDR